MYQIIGVGKALSYFALLCAALAVAWVALAPAPPDNLAGWWKPVSFSATIGGAVVALVGQTPIFPFLCRRTWLGLLFPPIDGEWRATLTSNWAAVSARAGLGNGTARTPVTGTMKIRARLFFVRLNFDADDEYSTSKTLFVRAARDAEDGSVSLHYVYRATVRDPKTNDSDSHDGAGALTVERQGAEWRIGGLYWTNRNWHMGLNTAGSIALAPKPAG